MPRFFEHRFLYTGDCAANQPEKSDLGCPSMNLQNACPRYQHRYSQPINITGDIMCMLNVPNKWMWIIQISQFFGLHIFRLIMRAYITGQVIPIWIPFYIPLSYLLMDLQESHTCSLPWSTEMQYIGIVYGGTRMYQNHISVGRLRYLTHWPLGDLNVILEM